MESEKQDLREQEAPLKNNDKAFVQVGDNGEPVIPKDVEKQEGHQNRKDDSANSTQKQ